MGKPKYNYVPIPTEIAELVDKAVEADSYPVGRYRSKAHYVVEAVKAQLRREDFLEKEK